MKIKIRYIKYQIDCMNNKTYKVWKVYLFGFFYKKLGEFKTLETASKYVESLELIGY